MGIVSAGDCELKNQGEYPIVLNILILNKNLNSVVLAAVYDIFYRADNNMRAQKVIDSMVAAPELNWFCQNLILGRLCGMTLYEILSLAIDLAILILAALSYLKDRKS